MTRSPRRADEAYALALCDEVVGSASVREARFDWLRGDPGKTGRSVRLPVDAFWPEHGLVVEFYEFQHDEPVPHFDKPDRLTVSGIPRGAQRRLYDARRAELIPERGLRLIVLRKAELSLTPRRTLARDRDADLAIIRARLAGALPGELRPDA